MKTKESVLEILSGILGLPKDQINLEFPENLDFGDYSSNVALQSPITSHQSPRERAEEIVGKLKNSKDLSKIVDRIEVAGPGFINFWLKKDVLLDNLIQIDKEKDDYGKSDTGKNKTVVVDYSSPNIAKPFGIGHLRSTIIGQALYNLYKTLGYEVIGDNHLGDWGTQFGKLLYMIDREKVTDLSIENLEKLYVEFHKLAENDLSLENSAREWFKKLEDGDSYANETWKKCVDSSMKEFERVYKLLGVKIDFAFGESYYESEMRQLMQDGALERHVTEGEDGAKIVDLAADGIKTPLMFLKGDGATTYATRDLATIKFRVRKWDPDIVIYEVGAEQTLHFQQVFATARKMGLIEKNVELIHTGHGLYLAPDGKKFSTRKGKTVKLEEVLDEAIERAKKLGNEDEKTAEKVGIGAIKYFDLMHSVQSNVVFDWEKIMNMEGNSGPYLQYTVARCNSVIQKAITFKGPTLKAVYSSLNDEEVLVLRSLVRFSEIIAMSAKMYSPNILCNYLYDLAQKYNTFYNKHRIIGIEDKRSLPSDGKNNESFRIMLTATTGQVLKNGLNLLGIQAPQRM